MLGKLLKYEFIAVSRLLLPLHLALILITAIGRGYVQLAMRAPSSSPIWILNLSLGIFYALALAAVGILTYVYLYILRPHRNLFSDEGYLMHTLPVTASQHILAKFITAACWIAVDSVLISLSVFLMLINPSIWNLIPEILSTLKDMVVSLTDMSYVLGTVFLLLKTLIGFSRGLLLVYMCLAIGHSFNEYKLLISLAIYLGTNFVISIIGSVASIFINWGNMSLTGFFSRILFDAGSIYPFESAYAWFTTILDLALAVGAFFVTKYFLEKRLNLE